MPEEGGGSETIENAPVAMLAFAFENWIYTKSKSHRSHPLQSICLSFHVFYIHYGIHYDTQLNS